MNECIGEQISITMCHKEGGLRLRVVLQASKDYREQMVHTNLLNTFPMYA